MELLEAIRTRRSTRKYTEQKLTKAQIETIVEAGRLAPSGGNSQTTHFLVITSQKVMDELCQIAETEFAKMEVTEGMYRSMANAIRSAKKGNWRFDYHAPLLVLTANQKTYGNRMVDVACALENMMLAANDMDLGSCWVNQIRWLCDFENEAMLNKLYELGMKESERVYGGMIAGYADSETGLPMRDPLPRTGNEVTWIEE